MSNRRSNTACDNENEAGDVKNPSLLRSAFPYPLAPRIRFEDVFKDTIDGREIEFDTPSV